MHHKPFTRSLDLYPVDSMSLVNRRLRRISIPILFKEVAIRLYLGDDIDGEQFRCLREALERKTHLMPLIRKVSIDYKGLNDRGPFLYSRRITGEDPETLFLVDVLSRCTRLEHLDLPREIAFGQGNQLPIISALNSHPSDNIRLRFMFINEWVCRAVDNDLSSVSLSRVICQCWRTERCSEQTLKTWLYQGLNIGSIEVGLSVDDSWMDGTYPGLTAINGWNAGERRSLQFTVDFLLRHPLLKKIDIHCLHECDMTPWRMAFASKMCPYSFDIKGRENGQWPQTQGNNVVKIDGQWLYNDIKVIFRDDIARGDVETVETLVRTLGEALPHPPDCPWLFVGIDFLSPVGEFLTSDKLIGILVRNMSHADILNLGKFVCDILTRECSQILEPGSAVEEGFIPGFDSFCKRLKQAMPGLHRVSGQDSQGHFVQV
ncbi:hypothetical protein K435DRAFT_48194 [Dendrothele bispora CBS 962.96]|uniref:Uncharacterized protein n=1 Tax=Dendrothele bispora (strain CBS 962.96) TaxID=1314807 RepID=A0A4S8KSP3_DENBC|nr:hypothetical protein K435DRAFT_48194 [Dendrothele bispora CBS 962.96]